MWKIELVMKWNIIVFPLGGFVLISITYLSNQMSIIIIIIMVIKLGVKMTAVTRFYEDVGIVLG